jgi:hypothetical protein
MKNLILTLFQLAFVISISAQKLLPASNEYRWSTDSLHGPKGDLFWNGGSFSHFILDIGDSAKIFPVKIKFQTVGIVRVTANGMEVWQIELPGHVMGIGLEGNKVLAFTNQGDGKLKEITVTSIDAGTGRKEEEKVIYTASSNHIEAKVLNNPNGQFGCLFIRTSMLPLKKAAWNDMSGKLRLTEKMELVHITADLQENTVQLKWSVAPEEFLGALMNEDGDLLMACKVQEKVSALRFNKSGEEISKLSLRSESLNAKFLSPTLGLDNSGQALLLSLKFPSGKRESLIEIFHFDFAASVGKVSKMKIDKDFLNSVKMERIKGIDVEKTQFDFLEPCGFVCFGDKIALLQQAQIQGTNGKFIYEEVFGWVVSFFDKDLNLVKSSGLEKHYVSYEGYSYSLGFHVYGQHLYVISPGKVSRNQYGLTFCSINLHSLEMDQAMVLDGSQALSNRSAEAESTKWFKDRFLLEYQLPRGIVDRLRVVLTPVEINN